ncbi:kinase-like domain-containing protein [Colletotrichum acutatum]|uniref:Kinase-like domain-containing protein n=1 Tax=Glomerella acutata TaxID=27357 RepID=A0AAD8XG90_GLOAC|nr:kinase-like domain-containing protein [Colletotrichum acutatum]KAK1723673.1 kinase-like domain-containing protein [Colletotrichum acutatum]
MANQNGIPGGATPSIQINDGPQYGVDDLRATDSAVTSWITPVLPRLESNTSDIDDAQEHIEARLWDNAIRPPFALHSDPVFWPSKLIEHLFDREAVLSVVVHLYRRNALPAAHNAGSLDSICQEWTNRIFGIGGRTTRYRLVFAILVLMQKASCIQSFINERLDDSCLPLRLDQIKAYQGQRSRQSHRPFGRWTPLLVDNFYSLQCRLFVQFIAKSPYKGEVSHYNFDAAHVLPWVMISQPVSITAPIGADESTSMSLSGGFGEVKQIVIHGWQHNFHRTLHEISAAPGCFALKKLYIPNKEEFEQEVKHLKRFGGRHPHIVTLLATFTRHSSGGIEYLLLFPWAECDLLEFWRRNTYIQRDYQLYLWTVDQICGIADALSYIHDPNDMDHLDAKGNRLYGRHGDIKPENVLWFKSRGLGNLVLSDLGLTRTHRQESRSNRPGAEIPVSPNYRPPECDIEGTEGRISRSFDIWTLGCLILEFMVWFLDGWEGYESFKQKRMSPYINSHDTPIYFNIVRVSDDNYAFNIKKSVTDEFDRLRRHKRCSQFISDLLSLVQTRMLIVQSMDQKRIASSDLCRELVVLQGNCFRREYYCAPPVSSMATIERPWPVEARLNKVAKRHIAAIDIRHFDAIIMDYEGPTRSAAAR